MRSILLSALLASLAGCSVTAANLDASSDAEHALPPSCQAFHDLCVAAAEFSEEADKCHEFMHDTQLTEALCAAKKDGCIAACTAALDGGTRDAISDAPKDASTDATELDH